VPVDVEDFVTSGLSTSLTGFYIILAGSKRQKGMSSDVTGSSVDTRVLVEVLDCKKNAFSLLSE